MNFGATDIMILVSMLMAIVIMSFTFPALGMTDQADQVNTSEFPDLQISGDRFDFAGDFPSNPGSPSQFTLEWREALGSNSSNGRWLDGDTTDGTFIMIVNPKLLLDNHTGQVRLEEWPDPGLNQENFNFSSEGETHRFQAFDYEIFVEITQYVNRTAESGEPGINADAEITIQDQPESGSGWISRIPIIGGLFGAGEALASGLTWIGSIIWWGITWMFELIANGLGILVDLGLYIIGLLNWLATTYASVISGADSFAAVALAVPGVILTIPLVKIVIMLVDVIWIG